MKNFLNFSFFINESKKENNNLVAKTSTIPNSGNGLFAKKDFKKGQIICNFTGELIDNDKLEDKDFSGPRGHYLIDLGEKTLDTYDSNCLAKYANDVEGPGKTDKKNNSIIYSTRNGTSAYICATRDIKVGEEIFLNYGKDYWRQFFKSLRK